ncbi:hypothetical protein ASG37_04875 [Sphingomonas sp. Leaf407]|uniref:hypothetical protein n=1 Tax=unclassified Sphingomonas TaxID=196159 RepID=UPI000701D64C|nr:MULTISPECIES: hypothetical protein [unclassified Sphingomonas]KQN36999.1 hypothetical protein ASE97_10790 [Sphingomonas sp. Leaf42]KQT30426.1 hypothetical protein ASG37_04875 [Sphingomonas sp. Leaf407]
MHAGLRSALFGSALPLAGFELGMDFRAGWYRSGAIVTRDPAALPGQAFTRPDLKFEEVGGVLVRVAPSAPLIVPGLGFLARTSYRNFMPNSSWSGAAPNSQVPQIGIATAAQNGITRRVEALGSIDFGNGTVLPYIDLRVFGTATANTSTYPVLSGTNNASMPDAAVDERWTASIGARLLPGGVMPGCNIGLTASARSRDGSTIYGTYSNDLMTLGEWKVAGDWAITTTPALPANTGSMWMFLSMFIPSGATVDYTIRLFAPSLVKAAIRGPYIPTGGASVGINTDNMRLGQPIPADDNWVILHSAVMQRTTAQQNGNDRLWNLAHGAVERFAVYRSGPADGAPGRINALSTIADGTRTGSGTATILPAGRIVTALVKTGGSYRLVVRGPDGAISYSPQWTPSAYPSPIDYFYLSPAIDGYHEFFGYRRGTFSDAQVAGMLAALA